jgi:phospholipase/lecithinase/hemolysin
MSLLRLGLVRGLVAVSLVAWWAAPTVAGPYSQMIDFGDSLSDTGNDLIQLGFPKAPYFQGRFSNGPNWIDQLAAKLGVADPQPSLAGGTNYAYGGATAATLTAGVPNLPQQVQMYLQKSPQADPKALYTVLMGANDFFGGQTDPSIPANAVNAALTSLIAAGAKTIIVPNLPPQGITPSIRGQGQAAVNAINSLDVQFNADLAADVKTLQQNNPGVKIALVDLFDEANAIIKNPGAFGFTNVTDEGINAPPATDLSKYLFWDPVHPTTVGHTLIADAAFAVAVPEPTGLALMGVCGCGLALRAWRRKRAA